MRSFEKLKWRCRRGVVELDILLLHFLENGYLQASGDEQAQFVDLLTWEDDELLSVLVGGKAPDAQGFDILIAKIRNLAGGAYPGGLGH
ncbi:succinate dehydrogenase assembly factor 2 [Methylomicrobium lacus]|uniref:FAD assembly factor SdhE n=1 Tax=Methylomicrobium lacus TaxID=136992 RepID=UPI0035A84DBB